MSRARILIVFLVLLTGCSNCEDRAVGWDLQEELPEDRLNNVPINGDPILIDAGFEVDLGGPAVDMGWVPEEVVPDVSFQRALNDRTSLAVDDDGTIWLAYHSCPTQQCLDVQLSMAYKRRGGVWQFEDIKRQDGTFGVNVAVPNEPIVAFLDPTDNTFKAARRVADGEYEFHRFPVTRTGVSDGFDLTPDGERMFFTYANTQGDPVRLFVFSRGEYLSLPNLDIGNAQAALERGLGADGQGNLYLVHRRGRNQDWGVAVFSLEQSAWLGTQYYGGFDPEHPSSLVVWPSGMACIAADDNSRLAVTCGDLMDLDSDIRVAQGERLAGYSSMVGGQDGTLYVAYNDSNDDLRLAKFRADGSIEVETVFVGETYGVSTAIDADDLLVISYYTCTNGSCRLEVISRPQD